jgi:hypothetical protein
MEMESIGEGPFEYDALYIGLVSRQPFKSYQGLEKKDKSP